MQPDQTAPASTTHKRYAPSPYPPVPYPALSPSESAGKAIDDDDNEDDDYREVDDSRRKKARTDAISGVEAGEHISEQTHPAQATRAPKPTTISSGPTSSTLHHRSRPTPTPKSSKKFIPPLKKPSPTSPSSPSAPAHPGPSTVSRAGPSSPYTSTSRAPPVPSTSTPRKIHFPPSSLLSSPSSHSHSQKKPKPLPFKSPRKSTSTSTSLSPGTKTNQGAGASKNLAVECSRLERKLHTMKLAWGYYSETGEGGSEALETACEEWKEYGRLAATRLFDLSPSPSTLLTSSSITSSWGFSSSDTNTNTASWGWSTFSPSSSIAPPLSNDEYKEYLKEEAGRREISVRELMEEIERDGETLPVDLNVGTLGRARRGGEGEKGAGEVEEEEVEQKEEKEWDVGEMLRKMGVGQELFGWDEEGEEFL